MSTRGGAFRLDHASIAVPDLSPPSSTWIAGWGFGRALVPRRHHPSRAPMHADSAASHQSAIFKCDVRPTTALAMRLGVPLRVGPSTLTSESERKYRKAEEVWCP